MVFSLKRIASTLKLAKSIFLLNRSGLLSICQRAKSKQFILFILQTMMNVTNNIACRAVKSQIKKVMITNDCGSSYFDLIVAITTKLVSSIDIFILWGTEMKQIFSVATEKKNYIKIVWHVNEIFSWCFRAVTLTVVSNNVSGFFFLTECSYFRYEFE